MEAQLIALIESYNKLIDSNMNLTAAVNKSMEQTVKSINSQQELLRHCGEIYQILNSKSDKTRQEKICINKLYNLITHNESKE